MKNTSNKNTSYYLERPLLRFSIKLISFLFFHSLSLSSLSLLFCTKFLLTDLFLLPVLPKQTSLFLSFCHHDHIPSNLIFYQRFVHNLLPLLIPLKILLGINPIPPHISSSISLLTLLFYYKL